MESKRDSILPFFKPREMQTSQGRRLERLSFVPNWVRNEGIAFLSEFVGTFMFLFMAFAATQVANAAAPDTQGQEDDHSLTQTPNTANLLYISVAFGASLAINAWAFFRISGGLFNPAVTLGLLLIGAVTPFRSLLIFVAQILASITAAGIVSGLFPGPLKVSTTLSGGTTISQGLFIEMFLTFELVFVIFMLAAEKHKATYLAPVGIGLALAVAELTGVYFTGGSLNPARSFGPAVITGFVGHHWIYWLGPTFGSLLAVGFYKLMKFAEYETANPGQDFNDHEAELFDPPKDAVTADEVSRPNVAVDLIEKVAGSPIGDMRSMSRLSGDSRGVLDSISGKRSQSVLADGVGDAGERA